MCSFIKSTTVSAGLAAVALASAASSGVVGLKLSLKVLTEEVSFEERLRKANADLASEHRLGSPDPEVSFDFEELLRRADVKLKNDAREAMQKDGETGEEYFIRLLELEDKKLETAAELERRLNLDISPTAIEAVAEETGAQMYDRFFKEATEETPRSPQSVTNALDGVDVAGEDTVDHDDLKASQNISEGDFERELEQVRQDLIVAGLTRAVSKIKISPNGVISEKDLNSLKNEGRESRRVINAIDEYLGAEDDDVDW